MTMYLASNSVAPNTVETEHRDGDEYLIVKDVPFVRAQELSGGYVPEREIKASTDAWAGVPLTANHPRNQSGEPVPANLKLNEVGVGVAEQPHFDGGWVRADLAINADRARAMGGVASDIVSKVESGDAFDVSSLYVPKELPSGEYDGAHRANVEGIAQPDSIALLPHKRGQCSIDDGCGINPEMVANAAVHLPMTSNAKHGEEMDAAAFSEGDVVEWNSSGGMAMGVIRDIRMGDDEPLDGEIDGDVTITPPAALIEIVDETEDGLAPTGEMVGHKTDTDTLSMVEDPPELTSNQDISYEVTNVSPGDVEFTDREWDGPDAIAGMANPSEDADAADALDVSMAAVPSDSDARDTKSNWKLPFRQGPDEPVNTRALVTIKGALSGARNGVEGISESVRDEIETWANEMLAEAPDDLFGADMEENSLVETILGFVTGRDTQDSTETMGAESPVGQTANNDSETTMSDKTAELVANHGFDADNLPSEDTECFDRIYDAVTENSADDNSDVAELKDRIAELETKLEANTSDPKDELAEDIVANSAEYDDTESVLEDYPTEAALRTKKDSLSANETAMPGTGATANAEFDFDDDDLDDISSGVIQ